METLRWRWTAGKAFLIVEFCDTSDADGIYRKYTACRIGDRIVRTHTLFGPVWMLKSFVPEHEAQLTEEQRREETWEQENFVYDNPHDAQLREMFDLARIEYGRIDCAFHDGKMQVWEINTNPNLLGHSAWRAGSAHLAEHTAEELLAAFAAIDEFSDEPTMLLNPLRERLLRRTLGAGARAGLRGTVKVLGLAQYERALEMQLAPLARRLR